MKLNQEPLPLQAEESPKRYVENPSWRPTPKGRRLKIRVTPEPELPFKPEEFDRCAASISGHCLAFTTGWEHCPDGECWESPPQVMAWPEPLEPVRRARRVGRK